MRGQGSLEFLLLIGGGVLVAVVIASVLVSLPQTVSSANTQSFATGQCAAFPQAQCNGQTITIGSTQFNCTFDSTANRCIAMIITQPICDDDGACETGENFSNCPNDCHCGNGACEPAFTENHSNCITDCPTYCGDGLIQNPNAEGVNEQCDQGNTTNGDGCNSNCQEEPNYNCSGQPSVCCIVTCPGSGNGPTCWNSTAQNCTGVCSGSICRTLGSGGPPVASPSPLSD